MRLPESGPGGREENRLTEIDWIIQMPGPPEIFQAGEGGGMEGPEKMMDGMDFMDAAGKKAWRGVAFACQAFGSITSISSIQSI